MKYDWQSNTAAKKICLASTILLIALLLIFLAVFIFSLNKLNNQIKLTTEHPFVVSRYVGEVRTDVAQMRIRTERLQSYNQPGDVAKVRVALEALYVEVEHPMAEIERLYLGPEADAIMIRSALDQIQKYQYELLEFASIADRTKEEITEFEYERLYPLYDQVEQGVAIILAFTQNTQMTTYAAANSLWRTALVWSIAIVVATISGLLLFQYYISRLNHDLFNQSQQFDTLSRTIDETFLIFSTSTTACDFVAENAARVLGIPAKDLQNDRQLFYNYVDTETKDEIWRKVHGNAESFPRELVIKYTHPQTQESCWLLARFYRTGKGSSLKHIITMTDQTEDLRARQALQDALVNAQNANNAKRDFLSRMSHEIRTPMNAIIGMTTIAAAAIENRTRVEDCLTKISYSSKHLLMLINDILDMSRIESNKLTLCNEPFDIYQFINSFVSIIYSQAQSKGIHFSEKIIGFADNTAYIGDSLRLNQILLNLTSNAIKFTDHGGHVTLEVKRIPSRDGKDRIRFTVADSGIGMTADALKRIYDPFEQADTTIAQKYGGTGLGMSITKNLVSLMGGYIDVRSQPGKGTTCTVEIAFDLSDEELALLPQEAIEVLNVLVVDDEQDMCEHTTLLLTKINIRAQWVLSGQEAVTRLLEARDAGDEFDICFIDWNMPEMDGVATTRLIRKKVGEQTPIIIISAYDWSDIEQEARAAGANAFISKPLFLSSVYNMLVHVTNGAFAHSATQKTVDKAMLKEKRILIAEDNELNLEIAEEMIKMSGAFVEVAHNGQEAFDLFSASVPGHFDAILMDVQMPVMNGYEATQRIRILENKVGAQRIPIIATTANAFTEDMSAALAAGMDAHISKPIDMKKLCEVLVQFIGNQK